MNKLRYFICFLLFGFLQNNSTFGCPCCHSDQYTKLCRDGTRGTPCCGYGKCDFLCCDCDGGCRKPRSRSLTFNAVSLDSGRAEFDLHDENNDGAIDVKEAYKAAQSGIFGNYSGSISEFKNQYYNKLDSNKDGNLTFDEIKDHDGIELWKL